MAAQGTQRSVNINIQSLVRQLDASNKVGWFYLLSYYENGSNKLIEKKFSGAMFTGNALQYNQNLFSALQQIEGKSDIPATAMQEKGQQYWNWLNITPGHTGVDLQVRNNTQSQAHPKAQPYTKNEKNFGAQVGNAVNNAVAVLVASKGDLSTSSIESKALEIINLHKSLKERLENPSSGQEAKPVNVPVENQDFSDVPSDNVDQSSGSTVVESGSFSNDVSDDPFAAPLESQTAQPTQQGFNAFN